MTELTRRCMIGGGAAAIATLPAFSAEARRHRPRPVLGKWEPRAPMPFPVQDINPVLYLRAEPLSAGSYKERFTELVVNAGGITGAAGFAFGVSDLVTVYDSRTDQWSYGPTLPEPRHNLALCQHYRSLYAVSGYRSDAVGGWRMRQNLWSIEDLNSPIWSEKTALPIPQAEGVAASLLDGLHYVGGRAPAGSNNSDFGDHIDTDHHWVYDTRTDRWQPRHPIPTPRHAAASAVVGNTLYVMGGRTMDHGNTPVCEVYEPLSDRWQMIAPMPKPIRQTAPRGQSSLAAALWNRKIYVFGGEWFALGGGGVYADVWEYDPYKDTWRAATAMARPRHGLGAVALRDGIYVVGGAARPGFQDTSAAVDRFSY